MLSIETARHEFPILQKCVFMNHAAVSPIPRTAHQAIVDFTREMMEQGPLAYGQWVAGLNETRQLAARLLDAEASEITFVKNTTHGLILVAEGIDWRHGDNVVIPQYDFPANAVPWFSLRPRGVEVRVVPEREGRFTVEDFAERIDSRTRVVSVSWVNFATGFRIPLAALGALCVERGVLFVVDAIQGLGAIPIRAKQAGIDYLVADGHKWLLAPEGCAVFFAAANAKHRLDHGARGWMSVRNPGEYLNYPQEPASSARRFEEGSPNMLGVRALSASLRLLGEIGTGEVWKAVRERLDELVDGLQRKGYRIHSSLEPEERSGILAFSHPSWPAAEIIRRLEEQAIILAERRGWVRASPHFYNTSEQTARVLDTLPG